MLCNMGGHRVNIVFPTWAKSMFVGWTYDHLSALCSFLVLFAPSFSDWFLGPDHPYTTTIIDSFPNFVL